MADKSELDPSELGTKQYWDDFYENELDNYNDHEETGEVWFGMASVKRVVEWTKEKLPDRSTSIIDIGCGNGMSLLKLAAVGYTNLTGVDYSQPAVDLAISLAKDKPIKYEMADLLHPSAVVFSIKYKLVLDKGTYDAISLTPGEAQQSRHTYINNVQKLLASDGYLFITSCNWTSAELQSHFLQSGKFILSQEIPIAQFKFGGAVGQTVTCLVFQAT